MPDLIDMGIFGDGDGDGDDDHDSLPARSRGTWGGWEPWQGSGPWWCGPPVGSSTGAVGGDLQIHRSNTVEKYN